MRLSEIAFLFLIIVLYTFQNFFCKKFSLTYEGDSKDTTPVFTVIGGFVVVLVTFFLQDANSRHSPLL